MTRGQRLEKARLQRHLTQKELEELTGVAQATISEIENDKRPQISANVLQRLADVLGITLDYLQRGEVYDGDACPAGEEVMGVAPSPDGQPE